MYSDLLRSTPPVGSLVSTPEGRGVVNEVELLTGVLHVRLEGSAEGSTKQFRVRQVKVLRAGKGKRLSQDELDKLKTLEKN